MLLPYFATADLEQTINELSVTTVTAGAVALVILVVLALLFVNKATWTKIPIFGLIAIIVVGTTLVISGGTIYLNLNSATGGPVHWHADTEFWACDNELELRDPVGLSNKIGTPVLHEHNDKRIHLEGVPVTLPDDASLSKFMRVIGGEVTKDTLKVPVNTGDKLFENGEGEEDGDGNAAPNPDTIQSYLTEVEGGRLASFKTGQMCGDQPAAVQVFAYRFNETDQTYKQTKLDNPAAYAIAQESEVPTGDCLIFEFGPVKDRTDRLCEQYGVRDKNRCQEFGVPANKHDVCNIREVQ